MGVFREGVSAGPLAIHLGGRGGLRLERELGGLPLRFAWPLPPPAAFAPGPSVRRPSEAAVRLWTRKAVPAFSESGGQGGTVVKKRAPGLAFIVHVPLGKTLNL